MLSNIEILIVVLVLVVFVFVIYILVSNNDNTEKMTDKEFEQKVVKLFNSRNKPKFSDYMELIKGTNNPKYKTLDSFLFLRKRKPLKITHLKEMRIPSRLVSVSQKWKKTSKK